MKGYKSGYPSISNIVTEEIFRILAKYKERTLNSIELLSIIELRLAAIKLGRKIIRLINYIYKEVKKSILYYYLYRIRLEKRLAVEYRKNITAVTVDRDFN